MDDSQFNPQAEGLFKRNRSKPMINATVLNSNKGTIKKSETIMIKKFDIEEFFKKSEDYIILKIENHLTIADFGLEDFKGLDIKRDYKSLLYMINYLSIEESLPLITGFGDFLEELLSYLYVSNKDVINLLKNKIIKNKNYLNFSEYIEREGWVFISKKFSFNKNIIHNNIKCGNNNPIKLNKIIEKAILEIAEYLVLSLIYIINNMKKLNKG